MYPEQWTFTISPRPVPGNAALKKSKVTAIPSYQVGHCPFLLHIDIYIIGADLTVAILSLITADSNDRFPNLFHGDNIVKLPLWKSGQRCWPGVERGHPACTIPRSQRLSWPSTIYTRTENQNANPPPLTTFLHSALLPRTADVCCSQHQ